MGPWIDRKVLLNNAKKFVLAYGYFFRNNAKRISSLVEIAVYNSLVEYYKAKGFTVRGENLGPKKSFKYKVTSSGLLENYSYFVAERDGTVFHLLHNTSMQSAHNDHLYLTADVVVTNENGATTKRLKNGKRHSYVAHTDIVTFAEVKHINPFPEVLFNFSGLVLEFMPGLIDRKLVITNKGHLLCPIITFTGVGSDHTERIEKSLSERYGINVASGTSRTLGEISGFKKMNRYKRPK